MDHVIICTLTDIPSALSKIVWTSTTTKVTTDGYVMDKGNFDFEEKTQVAKLTISSIKLFELKDSAASQSFTCKITVGNTKEITATKSINIFNPGRIFL
jgi:hypothetical protein